MPQREHDNGKVGPRCFGQLRAYARVAFAQRQAKSLPARCRLARLPWQCGRCHGVGYARRVWVLAGEGRGQRDAWHSSWPAGRPGRECQRQPSSATPSIALCGDFRIQRLRLCTLLGSPRRHGCGLHLAPVAELDAYAHACAQIAATLQSNQPRGCVGDARYREPAQVQPLQPWASAPGAG